MGIPDHLTCPLRNLYAGQEATVIFATTWTVALQAPLSMGFSRQEYWSGVPLPSLMMYSTYKLNKESDNVQP